MRDDVIAVDSVQEDPDALVLGRAEKALVQEQVRGEARLVQKPVETLPVPERSRGITRGEPGRAAWSFQHGLDERPLVAGADLVEHEGKGCERKPAFALEEARRRARDRGRVEPPAEGGAYRTHAPEPASDRFHEHLAEAF